MQRNLGKCSDYDDSKYSKLFSKHKRIHLDLPRQAQQQSNGNVLKDDPKDDPKINLEKLTDRQRIKLYLIRENNTLTISQMTQKLKQKQLK